MLYQLMGAIALVVILGVSGVQATEQAPTPAQDNIATCQQKDEIKADNVLGAAEDEDDCMFDDDADDEKISKDIHTFDLDDEEDKDDDDDMN